MMKKLFLLMTLIVAIFQMSSIVNAEQAAAEQYRQMFKSGNFYVEYQIFEQYQSKTKQFRQGLTNYAPKKNYIFLAVQNGKRIRGTIKTKWPDILYQNNKYYRFMLTSKLGTDPIMGIPREKYTVKVFMLPESEIDSIYLNPNEEWQYAKQDLTLPDELAIFWWNDPYRDNPLNIPAPKYNGSSKRTVDGKEYDCDQYVNYISSLANTNIALEAYNMLYDNGQLVKIQRYFIRDGKEYLIREVDIKTITSQVPDKAFTIKKKYKVYAGSIGDMNDLIDNQEQVEEIGGDK